MISGMHLNSSPIRNQILKNKYHEMCTNWNRSFVHLKPSFALELPSYSSLDVMTERLLYAVNHCSEVDADGGVARTANYQLQDDDDDDDDQQSSY